MPLDKNVKNVLVIGSGPVVIGQAAEFDYSGSQACLALREEGIRSVLLNPNPASIQTDREVADRVYLEPVIPEMIEEIIQRESVDSILASVGGQTALNSVMLLKKSGKLEKLGVRILGTSAASIEAAEDRKLFHDLMNSIGEPVAASATLAERDYLIKVGEVDFFPVIVRSSFSLGGLGGGIVDNGGALVQICEEFFAGHPGATMEIEKSLTGLIELEYEIIRDPSDSCISVCNMENVDPMGIHTGESIVVTPAQTLSDREHNTLRDAAFRIVRAIGIVGACNIQFALDRKSGQYYVVEVNPRTSRSSALASKASGFPIARFSTKIAVGYALSEIMNPVTRNTYAAFEPSMDYVTVKIPRWPFDKFQVDRSIGVQMKSIGEVMGIGRTLEEALMKAIAPLDNEISASIRLDVTGQNLIELLSKPSDLRIRAVFEALFRGHETSEISALTGYEKYFIEKFANIVKEANQITIGQIPENLASLKKLGISDRIISKMSGIPELEITRHRISSGLLPSFRTIDTCAGEFKSETPYFYSTYEEQGDYLQPDERKKVLVIGSGPNRIAQGIEFDYCSVKAVRALRKSGYSAMMINSNPETVSTDFDVSDRLFFEPVTLEHVSNVIAMEKPVGVLVQFSGQTGQNLSWGISDLFGESMILGTSPSQIMRVEDRSQFSASLDRLGFRQPDYTSVYNLEDATHKVDSVGLPAIVRSSFVIGGRSMDIIYDRKNLLRRVQDIFSVNPRNPAIISRYLENAMELDVDFVSDASKVAICGTMEHIEEAGTHSGDATMVLPASLNHGATEQLRAIVESLAREFKIVGVANLQVAFRDGTFYIIELNARASRTIPIVSKATRTDWISVAVGLITGTTNLSGFADGTPNGVYVKVPVFPFERFSDLDILLGPEMRSTGEGVGSGESRVEALKKAFLITNKRSERPVSVLITVHDMYKESMLPIARFLDQSRILLLATPGTHDFLAKFGIQSTKVYKLEDMREPTISSAISNGNVSVVVNLPGSSPGLRDGFQIRRLALSRGIPLYTNLKLADTFFRSVLSSVAIRPREILDRLQTANS